MFGKRKKKKNEVIELIIKKFRFERDMYEWYLQRQEDYIENGLIAPAIDALQKGLPYLERACEYYRLLKEIKNMGYDIELPRFEVDLTKYRVAKAQLE